MAVFLAANLPSGDSSPINWDKVELTEKQENTVRKVDDLLNELLKQLEQMFKDKPKRRPFGNGNDRVKPAAGEVGVTSDDLETSTDPVTVLTNETEAPEDETKGPFGKDEIGSETESNENDVADKIYFPVYNK